MHSDSTAQQIMIIAIVDGPIPVRPLRTARRRIVRPRPTDTVVTTQRALRPHFDTAAMATNPLINEKHHPRGMATVKVKVKVTVAQRSGIILTEVINTTGVLTMTAAEQAANMPKPIGMAIIPTTGIVFHRKGPMYPFPKRSPLHRRMGKKTHPQLKNTWCLVKIMMLR